jgi:glycosyltransferase involved in cell wall biosynthesis
LLTSGQPTLNPRLVKEADALYEAGYLVTVVFQYWTAWATEADQTLLEAKKWDYRRVGGSPVHEKAAFLFSRFRHKSGRFLSRYLGFKFGLAETAIGRCTALLVSAALELPAHLYIAHNLAALPAAVIASKKLKAKCGFDAEDFHRHEVSNDVNSYDVNLKTFIENKYIPQVDYLTVSSPQTAQAYREIFPGKDPVTILNVFDKHDKIHVSKRIADSPLKLFWFSQTVGPNRGLNDVIEALRIINNPRIELHLLGHCTALFKDDLNSNQTVNINYHDPVPAKFLVELASCFDVGLALEPGFSYNNDYALSNKLFTYLQAGLAVIASATTAQRYFVEHYQVGEIYEKGNVMALSQIINSFYHDRNKLQVAQMRSLQVAHNELNWAIERKKFLSLIRNTLDA